MLSKISTNVRSITVDAIISDFFSASILILNEVETLYAASAR